MVSNPGMNPILNPHAVVRVSRRLRQSPAGTVAANNATEVVAITPSKASDIGVWHFWVVSVAALLATVPVVAALQIVLG
ncbi:MAG: hypothetical protein ACFCUG_02925 [Thiotrichales bacterium]